MYQHGFSMEWCNAAADGLEGKSTVVTAGITQWGSPRLAGKSEAASRGAMWSIFPSLGGELMITADGVIRRCFRGRGHTATEESFGGEVAGTCSAFPIISAAVVLAFANRTSGR